MNKLKVKELFEWYLNLMEIFLNFVFLFPFAFCELNIENCERNSESKIDYLCLNYGRNFEKCQPIFEKDRLEFTNCSDKDIKYMAGIIAEAKNVTILDISSLDLRSIDAIDLQQNVQLKKFIASNNKLQVFPTKCISTALAIEEIDLSSNQLTNIEFSKLNGIRILTTINFSANQIKYVEANAFIKFEHLEYVDLSKNHLLMLSKINFCPKRTVSLHFEGNPIPFLNGHNLPIMENILVYATWATITQINFKYGVSGRFRAILDDNNEMIVGKSDGNSQYEIHCGEQSFKIVESLFVLKHQIENLPILLQCLTSPIQELHLAGNRLGSLNSTVFQRFQNLEALIVADTQLVEFDFSVINSRINSLDLSFNGLTSVRNVQMLSNFLTLQAFRVSGNKIQNTPDLISYLPSTLYNILDMSDNPIGPLNETTFQQLKNLKNLKIRNTQISIADFNPFKSLQDLRILDISNNNLEGVNFTVLAKTLHQLETLSASYCQIQNISEVIQYLGDSINELDLSGNFAIDLNANLFESLSRMNYMNLSNTNMKHFAPEIFQYLSFMKITDISSNRLRELDFKPSWALVNMIDIANNCFTTDYVKFIKRNSDRIEFLTNPFQQKSKEECKTNDQHQHTPPSNGSKTITTIIIAISVATILIILGVYIAYRTHLIEKLKMVHKRSRTATELNSYQNNQAHNTTTTETVTTETVTNEPIYEELDEYIRYDKLWHEFQPMPLSKQTQETYNTMNTTQDNVLNEV